MALVKMWRDFPEVAGGKTEAMVPEEAVKSAMDNGWKKVEEKSEQVKESVKEAKQEPVKEEAPKAEPKVETPKAEADKKEDKAEKAPAPKGQKKLRDE